MGTLPASSSGGGDVVSVVALDTTQSTSLWKPTVKLRNLLCTGSCVLFFDSVYGLIDPKTSNLFFDSIIRSFVAATSITSNYVVSSTVNGSHRYFDNYDYTFVIRIIIDHHCYLPSLLLSSQRINHDVLRGTNAYRRSEPRIDDVVFIMNDTN